MKSLQELFSPYPSIVTKRYLSRAIDIQTKLKNGCSYQQLGGKKLRQCRNLIRFRFGLYRLFFEHSKALGYTPISLQQRKNLKIFLKYWN